MNQRRALGYSASVAVLVFVVLALPVLQNLYGPVATLAAYAGVALVAGGVTWSLLSRLGESANTESETTTLRLVTDETDDGIETVPVEGELETLREQAGRDGDEQN